MQTRHMKLQRNQDFTANGGSKYLYFTICGSRDWLCNEIITTWARRENWLSNTCLWPVFVSAWSLTSVKTWKKHLNKNLMPLNPGKIYLLLWNEPLIKEKKQQLLLFLWILAAPSLHILSLCLQWHHSKIAKMKTHPKLNSQPFKGFKIQIVQN